MNFRNTREDNRKMLSNCLELASLTDVGKVRTYNEDAVLADSENGIAILADGMGGHRARQGNSQRLNSDSAGWNTHLHTRLRP